MKIALIPLDERPVNTRYPRMIADIAGVEIRIPPMDILSSIRQPADVDALHAWLRAQTDLDALIVSIEMLTSGGLIPSRISDEPLETLLARLSILTELKDVKIYAFSVITRIPDADYAFEEPDYWAQYGRDIHGYSQMLHRATVGQDVDVETLRERIPVEVRQDFMRRRLRNHQLNLRLLDYIDLFDLLVISSDDTSEYSIGTQEKNWIAEWVKRLELDDSRLLMYPGADEVGCVLLMRALLDKTPSFYVHYAIEEDQHRIAPYEDSPIHVTVERQIRALGGSIVADIESADLIVAINTPSAIGQEYDAEAANFNIEHARRAPYLDKFVQQIVSWRKEHREIILCDVAYPNGSDPDFIERLLKTDIVRYLNAYGAWNTAGNTIGTALAQGVAVTFPNFNYVAQHRLMLHRLLEDWGYQHLIREQIRNELQAETGYRDTTPENESEIIQRIEKRLKVIQSRIGSDADFFWHITNVSLPWHRTFEVDFDLARIETEGVVILGGSMGGYAALTTKPHALLAEETDWIGGQMTSQGVSALDEHSYIETFGGTKRYNAIREAIRRTYQERENAPAIMAQSVLGNNMPLNPGNGWVSRLCFLPERALEVLQAGIRDFMVVLTETIPVEVEKENDRVTSVLLKSKNGWFYKIRGRYFVDATDLGDFLPLSGTSYTTGSETNPNETQAFTYCFAVEYCPGEDHTIEKPEDYEWFKKHQPYTLSPINREGVPVIYHMFKESEQGNLPFWTYRRIHDGNLLGGNDISLINWVSNDYFGGNIIDSPDRETYLNEAKRLSLGFLYWLQTECPRDDDPTRCGYPELKLRPDIMGTTDGLSKAPYIRESRRIRALKTIQPEDIAAEHNPGARARHFTDSVGIGWYSMDLHPCVDNREAGMYAPTRPFQIPLGALIPQDTENVIAACKNIGTTHLTNGAYRLHPIEWAIGEAAGNLAHFCLQHNVTPRQVYEDTLLTWRLQATLVRNGCPIFWAVDVLPENNLLFMATQLLLVRDIIVPDSDRWHRLEIGINQPLGDTINQERLLQITDEFNGFLAKPPFVKASKIHQDMTWEELCRLYGPIFWLKF